MPFRPNYNQQRADRRRAQQQKHEEKQRRREERAAQRKAARDEPPAPSGDPMQPLSVEDNMARKKQATDNTFVLFDVIYEDGTRSSNRKVAAAELDMLDADASARAVIEAQDRKIAEMSGRPRAPIKSIGRSAAR